MLFDCDAANLWFLSSSNRVGGRAVFIGHGLQISQTRGQTTCTWGNFLLGLQYPFVFQYSQFSFLSKQSASKINKRQSSKIFMFLRGIARKFSNCNALSEFTSSWSHLKQIAVLTNVMAFSELNIACEGMLCHCVMGPWCDGKPERELEITQTLGFQMRPPLTVMAQSGFAILSVVVRCQSLNFVPFLFIY